jgi:glutamyl endopeptidase
MTDHRPPLAVLFLALVAALAAPGGLPAHAGEGLDGRGAPAVERVLPPDDRVRVDPTTVSPNQAVVVLTSLGAPYCTGWLYGPDVVATAAHCIYDFAAGTWFPGIEAAPARNGALTPFGSCRAKKIWVEPSWITTGARHLDYAAIKLDCFVGRATGWFGLWSPPSLVHQSALVAGYPTDKDPGQQWQSAGTVLTQSGTVVRFDNDTAAGMGGAPVFQVRPPGDTACAGACAFAIHTTAFGTTQNEGVRITGPALALLRRAERSGVNAPALNRPEAGATIAQNDPAAGCPDPRHPSRGLGFRVLFDWSTVRLGDGAASYRFQVWRPGAPRALDEVTTASHLVWQACNRFVADAELGDWRWRARAIDGGGRPGPWSKARSFSFLPCRLAGDIACTAE